MTKYVLVENRQIIHLGPIDWRHRFIQSELDDLEVSYTVPPIEQGYININGTFEIIPVGETITPEIDERWEDPVGPTWEYIDNVAIPTYTKQDKSIEQIKQHIKNNVAAQRYIKESAGTIVDIGNGVTVTIDTSRDGRAIFTQVYATLPDGESVNWKFPEGWITITKSQLGTIIAGGFTYIQNQYNWEKEYNDKIDSLTSISDLVSLYNELNTPFVFQNFIGK